MAPEVRETIKLLLCSEVQQVYDDPMGAISSDCGLKDWLVRLQGVAEFINIDWDDIVSFNSSEFERQRINSLLE